MCQQQLQIDYENTTEQVTTAFFILSWHMDFFNNQTR